MYEFITLILNLQHVSVTVSGRLLESVFMKSILQRQPNQCTDIKYCFKSVIHNMC